MRRMLSRHELRFLASGIGVVGVVTALGLGFWLSPWSPTALDRPADLLAQGDVAGAVDAYVALSDSWASDDTRAEALWRASQLAQTQLDGSARAMVLLGDFADRFPLHPRAGQARAMQATVFLSRADDRLAAAAAFELAAAASPGDDQAGFWLLRAGRLRADLGDIDGARALLGQAATHPSSAPTAWVSLGRIAMGEDAAAALEAYNAALDAGAEGVEADLARAGRLAALSELGQGLADLEDTGPDRSEAP